MLGVHTPERVKGMTATTVTISIEDAKELLNAYDTWAGSLPPEEKGEYLEEMDGVREAIEDAEGETK